MRLIIADGYAEMCARGAEIFTDVLKKKPNAVLGLATGSTVIGVYDKLAETFESGAVSFGEARTVNLDEYVGASPDDPISYAYYMAEKLFDRTDIDKKNTHIPDGMAENLAAECARYDALLDALPRDVQLLGIGSDGHIGFNEPGSPFDGRTHVAALAASTVKDNSRLFGSIAEVPRRAVTMGISDILKAKRIVILACGANKAKAVYDMISGEISESCPASALRLHADVTALVDREAAGRLK